MDSDNETRQRKVSGKGNNPSGSSNLNANGGRGSQNCLSQPNSPRVSRLDRVAKFISRSDANINKNSKVKRVRNDSNESDSSMAYTPEGSPSKRSSFMSKASGIVTVLRSRIGKHKSSRENSPSGQSPHQHHHHLQHFPSCCKRQILSNDSICAETGFQQSTSGARGGQVGDGSLPSSREAGSGSISVSVNVSSTNSEFGLNDEESVSDDSPTLRGNNGPIVTNSQNNSDMPAGGQLSNNMANNSTLTDSSTVQQQQPHQFYTMNVHLQRGKNLVARDACGSSDPYVKVKIGDKLHHKSKTIYRDLNPTWDEFFVLPISDLSQPVIFKVFDYDFGFNDDFMGQHFYDVRKLTPNKGQEINLILTESGNQNPQKSEESMGEIFLTVTLVPRSIEEKDIQLTPDQSTNAKSFKRDTMRWFSDKQGGDKLRGQLKSQIWSGVLTILLIEAKKVPLPEEGRTAMDNYVKFRLGNQKYKSRTVSRTTQPKWLEQFDLYIYEGQPQILEMQLFDESFSNRDHLGRCSIDIGTLSKEETHNEIIQLQEGSGELNLLLTISGTSGNETITDLSSYNPSEEELTALKKRYALKRSFNCIKDVGHLTVKVFEAQGLAALDIGGKSDPFCVLELKNMRLQTQTEYRTLSPIWNKIFTFSVTDYTSVLEVTVYDEDKNHKTEFLGKINIPLWKIKNGEKKWYVLKDEKLSRAAKGTNPQILLELNLIWNPIRSAIRVMDPAETKLLQPDNRLNREIFLMNIDRLKKVGVGIYDFLQYIQSCVEWEYPLRSLIALILYQVLAYTFQPFMVPLILMLILLKHWLVCSISGAPLTEDHPEDDDLVLDEEQDEQDDGDGEKKMTLRQKLQAIQDATQTLQNVLGEIAAFCESTRNNFRMTIPFITWLSIIALFFVTIALYFLPLRYLIMAYGLHKFLKPIIRPHAIPTNEVYNIIMRVPNNQEIKTYKVLRPVSAQEALQRSRSPPAGKEKGAAKKKYKFW